MTSPKIMEAIIGNFQQAKNSIITPLSYGYAKDWCLPPLNPKSRGRNQAT